MNYESALQHAGLTPDVRLHQLYLQGVAAGMAAQADPVRPVAIDRVLAESAAFMRGHDAGWHSAAGHFSITPAAQRQWAGLTDAEKQWIRITEWTVDELIEWVNTKLKEKNA
jgi:hypothetical protein